MRFILIAVLFLTVSCSRKAGMSQGLLIDVAKEGAFFTSCEIDVQYGKESSRVEGFASKDPEFCDDLADKIGSTVQVKYHWESISLTTHDNHIIDSVTVINQ